VSDGPEVALNWPFPDLNFFVSAQCLMVRRWRLIGHFPILYNPTLTTTPLSLLAPTRLGRGGVAAMHKLRIVTLRLGNGATANGSLNDGQTNVATYRVALGTWATLLERENRRAKRPRERPLSPPESPTACVCTGGVPARAAPSSCGHSPPLKAPPRVCVRGACLHEQLRLHATTLPP
jgi:hypothetical protein